VKLALHERAKDAFEYRILHQNIEVRTDLANSEVVFVVGPPGPVLEPVRLPLLSPVEG